MSSEDGDHPDADRLRAFDASELPAEAIEAVGAHLDGCEACRGALDALATASVFLAQLRDAAGPGGVVRVEETGRRRAARTLMGLGRRRERPSRPPSGKPNEAATIPRAVGPYELIEEVGRGGMGVVYKARHRELGRVVALKMILNGRFAAADDWERFRREAGFASRVQHPHIIHLYEVGIDEGRPYLALEWAEGGTLGERLDGVPWPPQEAARLMHDLALAVQESHRQGVIHRDLKPDNVLLQADRDRPSAGAPRPGRGVGLDGYIPKIADFGLAAAADGGGGLTVTGSVLGTPEYMAPEQAAGRASAVGPATDVHALGVILYELLTGRPPFRAASMLQTLDLVRDAEPVWPSRLQPGLPRDAEVICLKCLEKSPSRRYASAGALAEDLRRFLARESILARPSRVWGRAARWCARNPAVSVLSAAFAAAAAVGLSLIVWKWREAEHERANVTVAERETARLLARSQRLSADFALDRGLELARRGEVGAATLWMVDALGLAPADDPPMAPMIRRNLAAWSGRLDGLVRRLDHPEAVTRVAISPDGKLALTGCLDQKARLWDLATGALIGEPWPSAGIVESVAFRPPDGRVAVVAAGAVARLREVSTGRALGAPMPHPAVAFRAVFRRDGRGLMTVAKSDTVYFWDAETGAPTGRAQPPSEPGRVAFCAAYRGDGQTALIGLIDPDRLMGASAVVRWDVAAGRAIGPPLTLPSAVLDLACSPDGKAALTACADGTCRLWDIDNWEPAGPPMAHPSIVEPAVFSPEGKTILTGCGDGLVRRWDAATGRPLGPGLVHQSAVWGLVFDPTGPRALTGSADHAARLWDLAPEPDPGPPAGDPGPRHTAERLRRTPRVLYTPDRRLVLSADRRGSVKLAEVRGDRALAGPIRLPAGGVKLIALAPDGTRFAAAAAAAGAPLAQTWDDHGRPLATLPAGGGALAMTFSPDGRLLATVDEQHHLRLWDAREGRPVPIPAAVLTSAYRDVAFAADGRSLVAATTWGPTVRRFHLDAGAPDPVAFPNAPGTARVALSPDGTRVLTVSAKAVRLLDAADGRELAAPVVQSDTLLDAAFSPDGTLVVSLCEQGGVRVWDVRAGEQRGPSMDHPDDVIAADVGPDGTFMVAVCRDGTAHLWDLATARPLGPPLSMPSRIAGAAVLPGGWGVATTDEEGVTRIASIPAPVAGDLPTLTARYQVLTARRLDRHQTLTGLTPAAWRASLERLKALEAAPGASPMAPGTP